MAQPRGRRLPEWERRNFIQDARFTCSYCGGVGDRWGLKGDGWHVDHITPVSQGGSLEDGNLALACGLCNILKGSQLLADLPAQLQRLADHVAAMQANADRWPVDTSSMEESA